MEKFKSIYNNINVQIKLIELARERCLSNPESNWFYNLDIPIFAKKRNDKKNEIGKFFDELIEQATEEGKISLFAHFEKHLHRKVNEISHEIKKEVNKIQFTKEFINSISKLFIKGNIEFDKMSQMNHLLEKTLNTESSENLSQIIENRNYLVHGKRFGRSSSLSLKEHFEILLEVLILF